MARLNAALLETRAHRNRSTAAMTAAPKREIYALLNTAIIAEETYAEY